MFLLFRPQTLRLHAGLHVGHQVLQPERALLRGRAALGAATVGDALSAGPAPRPVRHLRVVRLRQRPRGAVHLSDAAVQRCGHASTKLDVVGRGFERLPVRFFVPGPSEMIHRLVQGVQGVQGGVRIGEETVNGVHDVADLLDIIIERLGNQKRRSDSISNFGILGVGPKYQS